MYKRNDKNYHFIASKKIRSEQLALGWGETEVPSYVIETLKAEQNEKLANELIGKADVVIAGSAPERYLQAYKKEKKLLFRYAERPLRKDNSKLKFFGRLIKWNLKEIRRKNIYMLCSSAYTYADYAQFGMYVNKSYKWGYFPEMIKYPSIDRLIQNKEKKSILWCGRLIPLKHPDDVISALSRLKAEGYSFSFKIIGIGEMRDSLDEMVKAGNLTDSVSFLGAMSPKEVRKEMENSEVFVFSSDFQEGWGAVVNEAMNSACAVVSSHAAGVTPFLIKNEKNGLIYKSGDVNGLYKKIKMLLDDGCLSGSLGRQAYQTIVDEWNAGVAAERFINLSQHILNGEKSPNLYTDGPCSKAKKISNNWFSEE